MKKGNTDNLVSVANFAKSRNITTQWAYELIKRGDVTGIKIDGKQFVKVK